MKMEVYKFLINKSWHIVIAKNKQDAVTKIANIFAANSLEIGLICDIDVIKQQINRESFVIMALEDFYTIESV